MDFSGSTCFFLISFRFCLCFYMSTAENTLNFDFVGNSVSTDIQTPRTHKYVRDFSICAVGSFLCANKRRVRRKNREWRMANACIYLWQHNTLEYAPISQYTHKTLGCTSHCADSICLYANVCVWVCMVDSNASNLMRPLIYWIHSHSCTVASAITDVCWPRYLSLVYFLIHSYVSAREWVTHNTPECKLYPQITTRTNEFATYTQSVLFSSHHM